MGNKLKVLLVSPLPPAIGGIATWTKRYLNWFEDNHYDCDIVDSSRTSKNHYKKRNNIFSEFFRTFRILNTFKKKIKTYNPDIVHINTSCSPLGIIRDYQLANRAKKRNKKLVVHYRCNIEDQIDDRRVSIRYLKKSPIYQI